MVTKKDIITEIATDLKITKTVTKDVIDAFWKKIEEHVSVGAQVQFIGIGKFYKKHSNARKGCNPQNGEPIDIPASDKLAFKSSLKF